MSTEHLALFGRIAALGRRHGVALPPAMQAELARVLLDPRPAHASSTSGGTWAHGETTPAPDLVPPTLPERYEVAGVLGRGGMGVVLRVRDRVLEREVALKYARPDLSPAARERFAAEARITAQLAHPGIVPVYDLGELEDGATYYTMPLVRGRTLATLLAEVHVASPPDAWAVAPSGATLLVLVQVLRDAADAVAHAHARGVVHRDLKPENVMVGEFGGTLVLDWGLVQRFDDDSTTHTGPSDHDSQAAGTPGYLPPEQALGALDRIGPPTDVHALGATLYEILAGEVPYPGKTAWERISRTAAVEPPRPIPRRRPIPEELADLAARCLEKLPERRPRDAGEVAAALSAWLDGARRRDEADRDLARAGELARAAEAHRRAAARLRERLPAADRAERLTLEDAVRDEERRARLLEVERQQLLRAALGRDPELRAAHDALAAIFRAEHEAAEAARDRARADEIAIRLRAHDRGPHTDYLAGRGAITLVTDPPGEVLASRYEVRDRRLVAVPAGSLGRTPLVDRELAAGAWLLEIRAEGRLPVRYPVLIPRAGAWTGAPPGETEPRPIVLPTRGELGRGERYVPAGEALLGGDPLATLSGPWRRLWVDGFVMRRFPVTNREYLAFLDALVAEGAIERAAELAPRANGEPPDLARDRARLAAEPDLPVRFVDGDGCVAFAAWESARTGRPWRLPWEAEWEKAARGTDGRWYPWGDAYDPVWARGSDSGGPPGPVAVDSYPVDRSPYGIRGVAGNVNDRCLDGFRPDGPHPAGVAPLLDRTLQGVERGGSWSSGLRVARVASRGTILWALRSPYTGFRLARSFP